MKNNKFKAASLIASFGLMGASVLQAEQLDVEKSSLKFGFIKLTDCAPLVIAKEKGFFEAEGLQVEVTAQPNWKQLLDNVITGELDGAHMLSGQPIAATIGFGTKAHIVTPYTLDLNGNAITVSNAIWEGMQENDEKLQSETPPHPITADSLKPIVSATGLQLQEFTQVCIHLQTSRDSLMVISSSLLLHHHRCQLLSSLVKT